MLEVQLSASLGWVSLTSLGIGAVIRLGRSSFTIYRHGDCRPERRKFPRSSTLQLLEYMLIHRSPSFGRPGAGPAIALSSSAWRRYVRVCVGMLRRTGGDDSHCRQRIYLHVTATMGESDRLDHRLGSNPGICGKQHGRQRGFSQHIVHLFDWFGWHSNPRWTLSPAYLPSGLADLQGNADLRTATLRPFSGSIGQPSHRHGAHGDLGARHPRVRAHQQFYGAVLRLSPF